MSVIFSLKSTTSSSFGIGKKGITIYQGTVTPTNGSGNSGDLYIYANGSSSSIYQNQNGTWNVTFGTGSVTNIATGTGLTGGPITNTGTISMGTSGVTAGTYGAGTSFPSITVDALGRITAATTVALGSIASQNANNISITGGTINGAVVTSLSSPVNTSDAATKGYVDGSFGTFNYKNSCRLVSTTNIVGTYSNNSGTNAQISFTAAGLGTFDGSSVLVNDRILVVGQTTTSQNGIYYVATAGTTGTSCVLQRATDYNGSNLIHYGDHISIIEGTSYKGSSWLQTDNTVIVPGANNITFEQIITPLNFNGDVTGSGSNSITLTLGTSGVTAGTYGNSTNIPNIVVNSKGLITSISASSISVGTGTVTSVNAIGSNGISVSGGPIIGSGALTLSLGAITPSSVASTGTISASNFSGTSSGSNTGDQTITLSGDISGSGTGAITTTLATVNANVGTFTTHVVNAKGLITSAGNLTASGDATGTASGTNIALTLGTSGVIAGTYNTVTVNAKGLITFGSNVTLGTGTVTNIVAGTGLTGGTITNTGTIAINYANANTWSALQTNSVGINVGNTVSASTTTLDYYQRGSFTPVIVGVTTPGTGTYSTQSGYYTRIGNRVDFTLNIAWSAHTGTGVMRITGLPYTNANFFSPAAVYNLSITTNLGYFLITGVENSSSYMSVYQITTGTPSPANVNITTSGNIFVTGTYFV